MDEFAPTTWRPTTDDLGAVRAIELPSGQRVMMRRVSLDTLVHEHVFVAKPDPVGEQHVDRIIAAALLRPRVRLPSKLRATDTIYSDRLPAEDRDAIVDLIVRGA